MSTHAGQQAERLVADYLASAGHSNIQQNWRQPSCEIDIVSTFEDVVYFTEVKFRSDSSQGSGLEYVTPKKLKQMEFAASVWVQVYQWAGDYRLQAASVDGSGQINLVDC